MPTKKQLEADLSAVCGQRDALRKEAEELKEKVIDLEKKYAFQIQTHGAFFVADSDDSDESEEEGEPKEGDCCLCDGKYVFYGNNPAPLKSPDEKCCNRCNETKVIPARFGRKKKERARSPDVFHWGCRV